MEGRQGTLGFAWILSMQEEVAVCADMPHGLFVAAGLVRRSPAGLSRRIAENLKYVHR
ncbi:MAG: hypothetical protein RLZ81_1693 [Pseudomonadota bacterium]|jgi:hypothetical protein